MKKLIQKNTTKYPSSVLNVKQLQQLCKAFGLQRTQRKAQLVESVDRYKAARKIQLFFFKKISKHHCRCSICLADLFPPFCKTEGHRYHGECLIRYFNMTGKTVDPVLKRKIPQKHVHRLNEIANLYHFPSIHFDVDKLLQEKFEEEQEFSIIRALEFTIQDMQRERVFNTHAPNFNLLINFLFSLNCQSAIFFVDSILEISKDDKQFSFQIRLHHFLKNKSTYLKEIMQKEKEEITRIQKKYRDDYVNFDYQFSYETPNDFLWRLGDSLHYVDITTPSTNREVSSTTLLPPSPERTNTPNLLDPLNIFNGNNLSLFNDPGLNTINPTQPLFPSERNIPMINPRFLAYTLAQLSNEND